MEGKSSAESQREKNNLPGNVKIGCTVGLEAEISEQITFSDLSLKFHIFAPEYLRN